MKKRFALTSAAALLLAGLAWGSDSIREWPGVVADAEQGVVRVEARATGLKAGDPAEFVLINKLSGHDYEALATTPASASDIRAALEIIGCRPGRPVDENRLRFWPRGTRLSVEIETKGVDPEEESGARRLPVQERLFDMRSSKTLPMDPLVFVGSEYLPDPEGGEAAILAADGYEPRSIISTYNEPTTLIDFPWQAPQGSVYGKIIPNPDYLLEKDVELEFIFRRAGEEERELDLRLEFVSGDNGDLEDVLLKDENGELLNGDAQNMVGVLSRFERIVEEGRIPYLLLDFDDDLSVSEVRELAGMISSIDTRSGVRVEPPLPGSLYYKAFLPDPVMADREQRGLQPAELCLSMREGEVQAGLKKAERGWGQSEQGVSSIIVREWELASPEDLLDKLREVSQDMPILLVYVEERIRLAAVMDFVRPVLKDYPTVFVLPYEWLVKQRADTDREEGE